MSDPAAFETARLSMARIVAADASDWWRAVWSDPEVTRYLPPRGTLARQAVVQRVCAASDHWDTHGYGIWALRDKSTGDFVGHCGLLAEKPSRAELVYALARNSWGRGLALEASSSAIEYGFDTLDLAEISALLFPDNSASARVLKKLGFLPDGEEHRFEAQLNRYVLRR